jgi:catechol 2,3-dioxygenase-like lactoylglutathione lyase family enzyme
MSWIIHHINVPSTDVRHCARFLADVLGHGEGHWIYPEQVGDLHHDADGIAYFGVDNHGLHVVRPVPSFAHQNAFFHNPTIGGHFALNVADLSGIRDRYRDAGLPVTDAGTYAMSGLHQIYALDPSANLVETNGTVAPLTAELRAGQDPTVAVDIAAVVVPSHRLDRDITFYERILGLGEAKRKPGTASFEQAGQTVCLAERGSEAGIGLDPGVVGAFLLRVRSLDEAALRMSASGRLVGDVAHSTLVGERVVYGLTPSSRLFGLMAVG